MEEIPLLRVIYVVKTLLYRFDGVGVNGIGAKNPRYLTRNVFSALLFLSIDYQKLLHPLFPSRLKCDILFERYLLILIESKYNLKTKRYQ